MLIFGIVFAVILFAIGVPIYLAFAFGGMIIILLHAGFPLSQLAVMYFSSIDSFILLAGPLFVLAGNLMMVSGLGEPLVKFLSSFTNRLQGGVAVATVIVCTFLGTLTGSVLATLAAAGIIMFPAMKAANYDRGFSAGVLCASANLGTLIPPSITLILFGYLTQTSVGQLFMAGIIPGLLVALLLSVTVMVIAKIKKYPLTPSVSWTERSKLFIKALPGLLMPIVILGGIYGGIFSPTEAAAIACVYCILVGILIYRKLNWSNFWTSVKDTAGVTGVILMLICGAFLLAKGFALVGLPGIISKFIVGSGFGPMAFLVMLAVIFIALGCIMDITAFLLLAIPIIMPSVFALGIDPIHLCIVFLFGALVGGITPPVAVALYFTSAMLETPIEDVLKGVIPFLMVMIITMMLITVFPEISTWLPQTMITGG